MYSQRSQDAFFSKAIETFFFIKYAQTDEGVAFLKNKINKLPDFKQDRCIKHNDDLLDVAV